MVFLKYDKLTRTLHKSREYSFNHWDILSNTTQNVFLLTTAIIEVSDLNWKDRGQIKNPFITRRRPLVLE